MKYLAIDPKKPELLPRLIAKFRFRGIFAFQHDVIAWAVLLSFGRSPHASRVHFNEL